MIYVSTGGFKNAKVSHIVNSLISYQIHNLELSGGTFDNDWVQSVSTLNRSKDIRFKTHNYFPPPEKPFVLNLASQNQDQLTQSIQHVLNTIRLSSQIGIDMYSFHAGFCIDLQPHHLGSNKTTSLESWNYNECLITFASSFKLISDYAQTLGVKIAVENNVLTANHLNTYGSGCLLLTDYDSYVELSQEIGLYPPLLMDVAHLNVTASSLALDRADQLRLFLEHVDSFHLSENDGYVDSNKPIHSESWFLPYVSEKQVDCTLEVYTDEIYILQEQIKIAKEVIK